MLKINNILGECRIRISVNYVLDGLSCNKIIPYQKINNGVFNVITSTSKIINLKIILMQNNMVHMFNIDHSMNLPCTMELIRRNNLPALKISNKYSYQENFTLENFLDIYGGSYFSDDAMARCMVAGAVAGIMISDEDDCCNIM